MIVYHHCLNHLGMRLHVGFCSNCCVVEGLLWLYTVSLNSHIYLKCFFRLSLPACQIDWILLHRIHVSKAASLNCFSELNAPKICLFYLRNIESCDWHLELQSCLVLSHEFTLIQKRTHFNV
jgi:hypothetical protein